MLELYMITCVPAVPFLITYYSLPTLPNSVVSFLFCTLIRSIDLGRQTANSLKVTQSLTECNLFWRKGWGWQRPVQTNHLDPLSPTFHALPLDTTHPLADQPLCAKSGSQPIPVGLQNVSPHSVFNMNFESFGLIRIQIQFSNNMGPVFSYNNNPWELRLSRSLGVAGTPILTTTHCIPEQRANDFLISRPFHSRVFLPWSCSPLSL